MDASGERNEAIRLLKGLESGQMDSGEAYNIAIKLDPILFYFVIRFLKEAFINQPVIAEAIIKRVAALVGPHQDLIKAIKTGENDIMREWFDDGYNCREFRDRAEEYVDLVWDKLES